MGGLFEGRFTDTDEVVADAADAEKGIYRATEFAVLNLAYYGSDPMYKRINGEIIACCAHEFEEPEVMQDTIASSATYGKRDAKKRKSARGLTFGPEKWDFIECKDEVLRLFQERQKRGDVRI